MTQTEINFNAPKLSPQCQKLYDRLLLGPITTMELSRERSESAVVTLLYAFIKEK